MRKLLNNPWFVGVAALAALAFVGRTLLPKKNAPAAEVPVEAAATPVDDGAVAVEGAVPSEALASMPVGEMLKNLRLPANLRDPFAVGVVVSAVETTAVAKAPEPDLVDMIHLSAVWIQKDATFALINDHVVEIGGTVGRFRIESATSEGVWLSHWKGRNFLTVGSDFTLNTPAKQPLVSTSSL